MLAFTDPTPKPEYANQIEFVGNPVEIRLRFTRIHPHAMPETVAEIILHPLVAKGLHRMLTAKIPEWEKVYGEIFMPDDVGLLESLFGAPMKRPGEEDEPNHSDA